MRTFESIFSIETKKFFIRRNVVIFFVIGLILIFLVQEGISKFSFVLDNKKVHQEMESEKVKQYVYYDQ